MNDNSPKGRRRDVRADLLDLIAQMPEDEQAPYREVVDEMTDKDIEEGHGLLRSQLLYILDL